jgi:hypothetical protein
MAAQVNVTFRDWSCSRLTRADPPLCAAATVCRMPFGAAPNGVMCVFRPRDRYG